MSKQKRNVIFVGAFSPTAKDGTIGGQGTACRSIVDSPLSDEVDWIFIDSSQKSQPPPNLLIRMLNAVVRVLQVLWILCRRRVDSILIFAAFETPSFLEKGLMAVVAKLFGKRVVMAFRSEIKSFKSDRYVLWLRKFMVRRCDAVICQSDEASKALTSHLGYSSDRILVIPNWIDSQKFQVGNQSKIDKVAFIFLGWIEKSKGVQHIVEAAHQLKEQGYSDFVVDIYGGGGELETLQNQTGMLHLNELVKFHGWVSGAAKITALGNSNVAVLPSYSEGMPNSLLEGMASGLAVIATPVGGVPSLIRSRSQGILVKVADAEALAEAMKELIDDSSLIRSMGETNRQHVLQYHEITAVWPNVARALGKE